MVGSVFSFCYLIACFSCWLHNASCHRYMPQLNAVENANHIFNAVHSAMRQWGSSLNHNGMSLFAATMPKGTILYHGSPVDHPVTGLEWLAFEREHSMPFARVIIAPMPLPPVPDDDTEDKSRPSRKESSQTPGSVQKPLLTRAPIKTLDDYWLLPGFIHTYTANKDLRLVYIDGSSAASTVSGTLDSTDILLLNDTEIFFLAEVERAQHLCHIAATEWKGRIDGFVRMEAGFEVIMCSFADSLDLVEIQRAVDPNIDMREDQASYMSQWIRASTTRYDGIGGSPLRVGINYDAVVTAYSYHTDLFQVKNSTLPRLTKVPQNMLQDMRLKIKDAVMNDDTFNTEVQRTRDWQAIADLIVQKYATPLQYFATSALFTDSPTNLTRELTQTLRPFLSSLDRNITFEIERCTVEFMPPSFFAAARRESHTRSVAERAIHTVSHRICSTLLEVLWHLSPPSSLPPVEDVPPTKQLDSIRDLIEYLAWTEWKKCRGCAWDELCSIPMFPFGVQEDHEHPRCRNLNELSGLFGYWDITPYH